MGDGEMERERLILDGLRRAQDAPDRSTASAVLDELFAAYGDAEVFRMRQRQDADRLSADVNLLAVFGPKALHGEQ